MDCRREELLIATIAGLLNGCRNVAVGMLSPIPGTAAILARARDPRVRVLGILRDNSFTDGGVELFDLAAQGRLDAFFLGGGQIDGRGNLNLVDTGIYPQNEVRWPGSFGSAFLYAMVPKVILFREEHSRRVLVPQVDFISAAGAPCALLTERALFGFDRTRARFHLQTVHPGHDLDEVIANTGFDFDRPDTVPETPRPDAETLALIRGPVAKEIARTYPRFAKRLFPEAVEGAS